MPENYHCSKQNFTFQTDEVIKDVSKRKRKKRSLLVQISFLVENNLTCISVVNNESRFYRAVVF